MLGLLNFDHIFPEIAEKETCELKLSGPTLGSKLPNHTYELQEFYCVEPGCDCRRVLFRVNSVEAKKTLASIAYGFDPKGKEPGPFLDPLNPQSQHSEELLELVKAVPLSDTKYLARLEQHYRMVKEVADNPSHPRHERLPLGESDEMGSSESETLVRDEPKIGRNDKCPCGSGKKYKKCCMEKDEVRNREIAKRAAEDFAAARRRTEDDFGEDDELDEDDDAPVSIENMSPYAALKFMEEEDILPPGRVAASGVVQLSVDEILKRLAACGIDASREAFLTFAQGHYSAWSISEGWAQRVSIPLTPVARDFLGLAACELWKRFCPDRPSMEMLDDKIQQGYTLSVQGKHARACDLWLEAWQVIRARLKPEMRTFKQAITVFHGTKPVGDWLVAFSDEVYGEAFDSQEYAVLGAELLEQLLSSFPDEDETLQIDLRCDRGELFYLAARAAEGEKAIRDLIRAYPKTAAGYVRLADCLEREGHASEAREILDSAVRAGVTDGDDFDLVEKCAELGIGNVEQKVLK